MSDPYLGEIRMFAGNFAPVGWLACNGQVLPIAQNTALFSLLGTTYGGDGQTTFALPDLRGRAGVHQGTGTGLTTRALGEAGGTETVTLTTTQMPAHAHQPAAAVASGTVDTPANTVWATWPDTPYAASPVSRVAMHSAALSTAGGGQPHDNLAPYLAVMFIIATQGIFPTPTPT